MKIENLRTETRGNRKRVVATVVWEDCERPAQELYIEGGEEFAQDLSPNPHTFLTASVVPAMKHGERRISMDAEICPELRTGLMTAMRWIHNWYGENRKPVKLETRLRTTVPAPSTTERAGFFFSGGVDALATLRMNRLSFPLEHPWSMKDGLIIYGLEVEEPKAYEYVMSALSRIAEEAGINLIPIYTNLRSLDDNWYFWEHEWEGAVFSAIAHALSSRFTVVSIAATHDIPNMQPLGSHPLIDPNYSSADLHIRHDGITLSRFDKIRLIAGWNVAVENIRVCNKSELYKPGVLNCGRCEKCVRTMLALTALGILDKALTFQEAEVTEKLVREAVKLTPVVLPWYEELIKPLKENGRPDLAEAIKRKITDFTRTTAVPIWRILAKEVDRRYLGGSLLKLKRSFS
jgi:hypothetical protein